MINNFTEILKFMLTQVGTWPKLNVHKYLKFVQGIIWVFNYIFISSKLKIAI